MGHSTDSPSKSKRLDAEDKLYSQFLNSTDIPNDQVIEAIFLERKTQHADDAIDYEDIDELADDELPEEEEPSTTIQLLGEGLEEEDEEDFDKFLENEQQEAITMNVEDEEQAQADADNQFDEMFGASHEFGAAGDENNVLFDDLSGGQNLIDDNQDINMGPIFEESNELAQKHKLELEEKRKLKKQKLEKIVKRLEKQRQKRNIKYHYPQYSKHKPFNFHQFFSPPARYFRFQTPPIAYNKLAKPLVPTKISLDIDIDQRKLFKLRSNTPVQQYTQLKNVASITQEDLDFVNELQNKNEYDIKEVDYLQRDWTNDDKFDDYSKDLILATTDWNDDAILNAGDGKYSPKSLSVDKNNILDIELEEEDDENIFDGHISENLLKLDMNDPNLLFIPKQESKKSKAYVPQNDKMLEMKFNISNDNEYEMLRKNYNTKVRSQLSNLNIEHSVPALRLQTPYYKVKLSAEEARSFHRPIFNIRPGTLVTFSKLKLRKKKKDRGKALQDIFKKTTDLTTADTANIVAMEYSEQYPQILSNYGMGSKLINYYRKERPDDSSRPKAQVGETHVLGVEDRSPFWNYGEVAAGDFVPTLYNNMIRAPIFKHEPKNTDFLLIRSQGAGSHQKFYLRQVNFAFAVGNTFPVAEVPAPHSRKVTNTSKNRLKMIVFRVMNNKGIARISVKDVSKHFPDQNDMQNRQRLKEFMEYQRHGEDQGFWKMKGGGTQLPTEDEIRTMITPEDSALMDTMQYGQQILDDAMTLFADEAAKNAEKKKEEGGKHKKEKEKKSTSAAGDEDEKEDNEDGKKKEKEKEKTKKAKDADSEIDLDDETAPWNLTKNFIVANQTKSMLQLNGEGDPSGIGLGYSLLRATQKNGFKPLFPRPPENIPKSNTASHQQKLYEEEVKRIWYSQRTSLVDHGPDFNLQAIYNEYKPVNHEKFVKNKLEQDVSKNPEEPKILRITRRVRDENGILQRKVETLTDPRLIKAYVKRKKDIEDELLKNADVGDILPTNDKELNKIRRKALEEKLANLEKRAKQSKAKKPPKDLIHAAAAAGGTIIDANTVRLPDGSYAIGGKGIGKGKSRTRRCASCGAFGHIKTNKACPLYSQMIAGLLPPKNGSSSSPVQSSGASVSSPAVSAVPSASGSAPGSAT